MVNISLPQVCNVVTLLAPAADAAGRTSAYVSLKNALKVWVVVHINQGNAATILLSLLQATAVAGTASKAGPSVDIWANQASELDAFTKQTSGATFTTSAAVKGKIVIFEFKPEALDSNNAFDCIGISTGASNAANITSAQAIIYTGYQQAAPPSAVTD
jgi:hypothetical protein